MRTKHLQKKLFVADRTERERERERETERDRETERETERQIK